jgi:hypothetical protein
MLLFVGMPGKAQDADTIPDIQSQPAIEEAYENILENADMQGNGEITVDISFKKIDINAASYDDWASLGILTPSQITAILQHRGKHGDFLSVYELGAVDGISQTTLQQLLPFLYVRTSVAAGKIDSPKHEFLGYWKNSLNNDSFDAYAGENYKVRSSYSFESLRLSARMQAEKDEGEPCFSRQISTFDYLSAAIEYRPQSWIKKIIVGDYTCQFGQGLVLWNRLDFSQNIYTANLCRIKSGARMHRTFEENNFFRGVSVTAGGNGWELTCWGSTKFRDATVSRTDSAGTVVAISSFQNNGIHATAGQLAGRHSVREDVLGADMHWEWKNVVWGFCGYHTNLSADYVPRSLPYLSQRFTGNRFWATSSYARLHMREAIFYAENAVANSLQNFAFIGGVCYMPQSGLTFNWLYRYYPSGYFAPYANAYSVNTSVSNEKGFCVVANYQFAEKFVTLVQFDFADFLWLRYGEKAPTDKNRLMVQQEYITEPIRLLFRYRYDWGGGDLSGEGEPVFKKQHYVTFQVWQQVQENLMLHHRFDATLSRSPYRSKGMMIAQDVDWKVLRRLTLSGRYALFTTDDWNSRLYAYEKNIWQIYSYGVYNGNGVRASFMVKWDISRHFRWWLRYGLTVYSNKNTATSGTLPDKADVAMQIYWRW